MFFHLWQNTRFPRWIWFVFVFFAFYAEIQNGQQKRWENFFWEKSPVDSADKLRVKNFVEIALSRSISKINRFLRFMQKFKMAAKSGGKTFLRKVASRLRSYPSGQKFRRTRSISLHFWNKRVFAFNSEIQDGSQKWQENNICEKLPVDSADTLYFKIFVKIALSRSVSDKCVFAFSALRKIVTFSKSLISRPFCIGSLPKVNDFQTSIQQTYLPNFMWIGEALLKLSSGQAHPFEKHVFGHVTSMIGWNVMISYSEIFPRATAYACQIWRESTLWLQSYCKKKMRIRRMRRIQQSRFTHIQTSNN